MKLERKSPAWFLPIGLLATLVLIELIHVGMHGKYCKTEAEWMNEKGMAYDRESSVE